MMSKILNSEIVGKRECSLTPFSKEGERVLEILKDKGYLADFKVIKNEGKFVVQLNGKINKCGVISPNFNVKKAGYEAYEKRFLPAKDFGLLLVTTTQGIMTHTEAQDKGLGGRLIGYCY